MQPKTPKPPSRRPAASRANGAKSKGPTSAAGKKASSQNATRHGLLAKNLVLDAENQELFLKFIAELTAEHAPANPTEMMLVENMAAARWRLCRIWYMQKTALNRSIEESGFRQEPPAMRAARDLRFSLESGGAHPLLLRYEAALDRQFHRALSRLQKLQADTRPPAAAPDTPPDPAEMAQLVVLDSEQTADFLEIHSGLVQQHNPSTRTEFLLVDSMALARWRIYRTWNLEKFTMDLDMRAANLANFKSSTGTGAVALMALNSFETSARAYEFFISSEITYDRQFHRALYRLAQMKCPQPNKPTEPVRTLNQ